MRKIYRCGKFRIAKIKSADKIVTMLAAAKIAVQRRAWMRGGVIQSEVYDKQGRACVNDQIIALTFHPAAPPRCYSVVSYSYISYREADALCSYFTIPR